MKKSLIWSLSALLLAGTMFTSCKSDDDNNGSGNNGGKGSGGSEAVALSSASFTFDMPLNLDSVVVKNDVVTMTNVQTKNVVRKENVVKMNADSSAYVVLLDSIAEGIYNVNVAGTLVYRQDGVEDSTAFSVNHENVAVKSGAPAVNIVVNTYSANDGFVISEIFFAGTVTSEGKQYSNDQYVVITNNSDQTLYADSLAFLESSFNSGSYFTYVPDIRKDTFAVAAVYMIPGSGKDHPVAPGQSITLAVNAIDHTEANPASFSLADADFEFYDVSSNPKYVDVDNPNVPNLTKYYCYTATLYTMHNRGFKAMAIAKMPVGVEEYLAKYEYVGNYEMNVAGDIYTMTVRSTFKIPNSWIIDGVNLSTKEARMWNVLPASIDLGWTHCGETLNDKSRYGKSVIRKKDANGKYIDTNNSTTDFQAEATASRLVK